MKELIDHIPFIDVMIIGGLVFFIYLGWTHGLPKFAMVAGAIYTGFLLSSIYYHLFAVALLRNLNIGSRFVADFIGFLALDIVITVLMVALLMSIFGHIDVRGRLAIFDKLGGTIFGFISGLLVAGILITLLRVPYEENKTKMNSAVNIPAVALYNDGFARSTLAPIIVKGAPYLLASIEPLLPPGARDKGAVPLLEGIVAQQK